MAESKILTICGSMKFSKEMLDLQNKLEMQGMFVFIPDLSENNTLPPNLTDDQKKTVKRGFIQQHFAKIQKSDAILVANFENKGIKGYVGSNTLMEIAVAYAYGKKIYILHPLGEQNCRGEVEALCPQNLRGDVSLITT